MKKIFLCALLIYSQLSASQATLPQEKTTEKPQSPLPAAVINVDDLILKAFEKICVENKSVKEESAVQGILFSITTNSSENVYILTLKTMIDEDELDQAKEILPIEKQLLRAQLLEDFRKKLNAEELKKVKTPTGMVLLMHESLRNYRAMGNITKCHIISDDNLNDCLECKVFIDALRFQHLKDKIEHKKTE